MSFDKSPELIKPPEKLTAIFSSKEEAIKFVQDFWEAMPHGAMLSKPTTEDEWEQELTMGDRTIVRKGVLPHEKNKWIVLVMGNNQPLTKEAVAWLKEHDIGHKQ